ncbi:MAG: hypothetical protein WCP52_00075 [Bacteroidota bacterium]
MANTSNNNKLDEKIKQSLSNYKATNSVVDWSRMEEILDSTPRANTFKWNYLFSALLGIIIFGGAYFMYDSLSYSKLNEKKDVIEPTKLLEKNSTLMIPKVEGTSSETSSPNEMPKVTNAASVENKSKATKFFPPATLKKDNIQKDVNVNIKKPTQILIMGNEPVFGDMLDSAKGIIGATKEKESTKKSAVIHSESHIGWNKFINQDSLRLNNKSQSDSLKLTPNQ